MSDRAIESLLRRRFALPEFVFVEGVRNSTGFAGKVRTADALAMSVWPSRGLDLNGIEVKRTRGDFRRENADPAKAEEIAQYCDFWWIAAGDDKVVPLDELPASWGLLVVRKEKLVQVKAATRLTPAPIDRCFLASLLRRVHEEAGERLADSVPKSDFEKEVAERVAGRRDGMSTELAEVKRRLEDLQKMQKDFEAAAGVEIHPWNGGRIGAAVKLALTLESAQRTLRGDAERFLRGLDTLKKITEREVAALGENKE